MTTNDARTQLEDERRLIEKVMSLFPNYSPATTEQLADALTLRNAQVKAVLELCDPEFNLSILDDIKRQFRRAIEGAGRA